MYCSKCGSPVAPNSAFCQNCGTPALLPAAAVPGADMSAPVASAGAISPHWLPPATRTYAGFWLRFVAHMIDSLLLGAVFMVLFIPLFMLTGLGGFLHSINANHPPDPALIAAFGSSIALIVFGTVAAGWLYNAYFESSEWQSTVGKKVMNLVVTDLQGNRISFGRASGRFFAKLISGLIPFGIGYILAGITEKKQALHDMIASCLVLRS